MYSMITSELSYAFENVSNIFNMPYPQLLQNFIPTVESSVKPISSPF